MNGFWQRFWESPGVTIGVGIIALVALTAIAAPWFFPVDPMRIVDRPLIPPFEVERYWLGTDALGRNVAAALAHGAGVTLMIGLAVSIVSFALGTFVGALAGYGGGWLDDLLMRLTELVQTVPSFIFALTLVTVLGASVENVILALALVSWPSIARVIRAEFLSLRNREFVQSCYLIGMSETRIVFTQILPNALPPAITLVSVTVAFAILMESALAFLGLSDPEVASWGWMIAGGRPLLRTHWHLCAIPGVALLLTVLAVSLVGNAVAAGVNPRRREG